MMQLKPFGTRNLELRRWGEGDIEGTAHDDGRRLEGLFC